MVIWQRRSSSWPRQAWELKPFNLLLSWKHLVTCRVRQEPGQDGGHDGKAAGKGRAEWRVKVSHVVECDADHRADACASTADAHAVNPVKQKKVWVALPRYTYIAILLIWHNIEEEDYLICDVLTMMDWNLTMLTTCSGITYLQLSRYWIFDRSIEEHGKLICDLSTVMDRNLTTLPTCLGNGVRSLVTHQRYYIT